MVRFGVGFAIGFTVSPAAFSVTTLLALVAVCIAVESLIWVAFS